MLNPLDLYHNTVRAKEIVTVFARYGFNDLFQHLDGYRGLLGRFMPKPKEDLTTWERIRHACEDLGPTFVKMGQILSMRPDIVPQELARELRKLQDAVRRQPNEEMMEVLREELGQPPEALFSEFNPSPIGTASLAQVYLATLRENGERVAVKIQRPNIQRQVETDLDLLGWFVGQMDQRVEQFQAFDLPVLVEELKKAIIKELDFRNEARNMQFFNSQNPNPEEVFAPKIFDELTTSRVIVMEWIEGQRMDEAILPKTKGKEVARAGARSLLHQVLISGFFHADPHPGNLSLTLDRRICFFDWGMVGQLTRRMRHHLGDLMAAAVDQDAERIVRIAAMLAQSERKANYRRMEKEITFTLREHFEMENGRQQIGRLILRLFYIFGSNGLNIAHDYSLMAKAVLSIEEAADELDPDFDIRDLARPVLRQLQREKWSPSAIKRDAVIISSSVFHFMKEFPTELVRALRRLDTDELTLNFQHKGLEGLTDSLNSASNRITLGVIIGSLLIGSSLIIRIGNQPYFAIGVTGYSLSAVLGFWVIIDIIRHGKHR